MARRKLTTPAQKRGRASAEKGKRAERWVAERMMKFFPEHNIIRMGGQERYKKALLGDVVCLQYDARKHEYLCDYHDKDCMWEHFFIDVKRHARLNRDAWWRKVQDDSPVNRRPILIYHHKGLNEWHVRLGDDDYELLDDWLTHVKVEYGQ